MSKKEFMKTIDFWANKKLFKKIKKGKWEPKFEGRVNMKKKVAIINFGMGNLNSVQVILNYLAIKNDILENPQNINNYSHVVLPGVGL